MTQSLDWLKARPIAHRGLHDALNGVVENSKTAFARAIAGNYAIECDLQISGDGEAMVFHDHDLARLTEQEEQVNTLRAEQLKQVRFKTGDDKMQTLDELLVQVDGKVPLIIELKSLVDGDLALAERAVEVLSRYNGDYCIMSFAPLLMRAVKRLSPQIPRGAVVAPETEDLWMRCQPHENPATTMLDLVEPDFLSYDVKGLPSAFVATFKSLTNEPLANSTRTRPVICWTVKDQKTADFSYQFCDQITFEGFTPK